MVPTTTQKRLKAGDQWLRDRLKHFAWSREELIWLKTHHPALPNELRVLIDARLRELAPVPAACDRLS
jgi:hypothetical protein